MLFDSHIHFFPDKLKDKVYPKLSKIAQCDYYRNEILSEALNENKMQGVTHALGLHIATNPTQQTAVNDFAISSQSENLLNFGSVHPRNEENIEELHRIHESGLKGIKLHPDYQEFFVDDPKMSKIYETCEKLGLMIAFHAGRDPYSPDIVHSMPNMINQVAKSYKSLTIIAAHMGGMEMYDEVAKYLAKTENVYFDTAMMSSFLTVEQFENLAKLHGVDKILFATDSPWSRACFEKDIIEKTNLSADDKEKIYYKNAFKLFEIKEEV